MNLLSYWARAKKVDYFLKRIPKSSRILEIGCGRGWVRDYLTQRGWSHYIGLDIVPPADIVGDILNWREIGIDRESFDVILAFEVVEHIDCFRECHEILRPGGMLMLTSPLPHMDWLMQILERIGLNQRRTSPHDRLIYFEDIPYFQLKEIKIVGFVSQWGILRK